MAEPLFLCDPIVVPYVAQGLEIEAEDFKDSVSIGIMVDGVLSGGVLYHNYQVKKYGKIIEGSIFIDTPRAMSKKMLKILFYYPFRELGVTRFWAQSKKSNTTSQRFLERIGFNQEGFHPKAYDGKEGVYSYSMLYSEYE